MNSSDGRVVNKRQSLRETIPLTKQQTTILTLDSATRQSMEIKQIMLENPNKTTTYAHQIDAEALFKLCLSTDVVERLFANVCYFALGKVELADQFAADLLKFMQELSDDENHSQFCIYLYKAAKFYLPAPLAGQDALVQEYNKHKIALQRNKLFLAADYKQNLEDAAFAWLDAINEKSDFVYPDVRTLKLIVGELTKPGKYSPLVDCMVGFINEKYQDKIPAEWLEKSNQACHLVRSERNNLESLLRMLMHPSNQARRRDQLLYPHKLFEMERCFGTNYIRFDLPNLAFTDALAMISERPILFVNCWIEIHSRYGYSNLSSILNNSIKLSEAMRQSDDAEVTALLWLHRIVERKLIFNPIIFQQLAASCTERMNLVIKECFNRYKYDSWSGNFDEGMNQAMIAAVKQHLAGDEKCEEMLKQLEDMRPVNYLEKVNKSYETAKTAVIAYAAPVADSVVASVSKLSASWFNRAGSIEKPAELPESPKPK